MNNILTPREEQILSKHLFEGLTLAEIGRELHISPGRVRQLEARALEIFRCNPATPAALQRARQTRP